MLTLLLLIPILTAAAIVIAPARSARMLAMSGSLLALAWTAVVWFGFDFERGQSFQFIANLMWIESFGLSFSLGVDSVALLLVALTALMSTLAILGSFSSITTRVKEYYAWLLVLEAAMLGVFMARDLIVFYIAFEFTLLPMFFLIATYGSANRARASIVFFLYTFTGSMIALAGLIYVATWHWRLTGGWTFDIGALTQSAQLMDSAQQSWVLLALLCGFAVKVPLFPVHTWLPLAHTEAPTAGSVILAAVLLKLGTYGLYRFALPMTPVAITQWSPLIAILCIIGIIYGALICWAQRDVKKLIAYSSVSHLGFCVLGLVALNTIGVSGSIFYMINHGLSTGALFFLIGMFYERYHTRSMDELGGLARRMPVWTFFMIFFIMSSVALPGLNGFIGEFFSLLGAFVSGEIVDGRLQPGRLGPWYAAIAATGMILGAIYLLYLAGRLVFGQLRLPVFDASLHRDDDAADHRGHHQKQSHGMRLPRDLNGREIAVLTPLAVLCVAIGVQPSLIQDRIDAPVRELTGAVFNRAAAAGVYADRSPATPIAANADDVQDDHEPRSELTNEDADRVALTEGTH